MKKIILIILVFCFLANSVGAISASFDTVQTGSNITCTSTSSGTNITGYKWTITMDSSTVGSTGWTNDTNMNTYTFTLPDGGQVKIELCVRNNSDSSCVQKGLGYITGVKDLYPPEHYQNCKLCEEAGYYWYNDSCHKKAETLPWNVKKPLQGAQEEGEQEVEFFGYSVDSRLLIVFVIVIVIILVFRGRKKNE